jgi:hypothetical protein
MCSKIAQKEQGEESDSIVPIESVRLLGVA